MPNAKHLSCGLLRRDHSGRWFYGEKVVGMDGEPFPGALEEAMAEVAGAPEAELSDWAPQAVQLSLDWPTAAPTVNVDANMTLATAHGQVWRSLDEGAFCPCCQRNARRYKRPFHSEMATFLVRLSKMDPAKFHHLREVLPGGDVAPKVSTDGSYLVHWGLVKRHPVRTGCYRVTKAGIAFVRGQTVVPKVAWVYDGRPMHYSEEKVTIRDVLGSAVNVDAMLADTAEAPP